jgi:hypothetical protein
MKKIGDRWLVAEHLPQTQENEAEPGQMPEQCGFEIVVEVCNRGKPEEGRRA